MGTLSAPPPGNPQQGGTGAGNSGKTGGEGAQMRAMKAGEAQMRAQFVRTLAEYSELGGKVNFDALDAIAAEAIAALLPTEPQPLPGPSNREPIPPSNRP